MIDLIGMLCAIGVICLCDYCVLGFDIEVMWGGENVGIKE